MADHWDAHVCAIVPCIIDPKSMLSIASVSTIFAAAVRNAFTRAGLLVSVLSCRCILRFFPCIAKTLESLRSSNPLVAPDPLDARAEHHPAMPVQMAFCCLAIQTMSLKMRFFRLL